MPSTLAFYISGHGFGHASRDVEVINAFARLRPDARILVRTAAPRWLFDLTLTAPVEFEQVECDTGIVQIDSLHLDADATIERAAAFHRDLDARAEAEARVLAAAGASLVVGDIPPLALLAAERAEVPGIALGNFTWDWIYAAYPEALRLGPDLLQTLRSAYRRATLALRLPLFGGFEAFGPRVRDVPFIARHSRMDRSAARRAFGIPPGRPAVLISFGGYGLAALDPAVFARMSRYTFLLTADPQQPHRDGPPPKRGQAPFYDFRKMGTGTISASVPREMVPVPFSTTGRGDPPQMGTGTISGRVHPEMVPVPILTTTGRGGNVIEIDEAAMYAHGLRYEDLVAAADVVVTKPGYGIVAECLANDTAVLYTSRGHFVEYDVFVAGMPRYVRCRFIGHEELFSGAWEPHLDRLLKQPPPPEHPRTDGAEVVAKILADYL